MGNAANAIRTLGVGRMQMRTRSVVAMVAMAASLGIGVAVADASEPAVSATPGENTSAALAAVRAADPRFATLPDFRDAQKTVAADFDFAPTLAGSWIKVLPTFGYLNDPVVWPEVPGWMDPGDRLVEVMLVEDCQTSLRAWPTTDPCGYRETWLFEVSGDGVVRELSSRVLTGP